MSEHRTIVVGVSSAAADSPVLAAALLAAEPGDTVRLVHAYVPPVLTELDRAVLDSDAPPATAAGPLARAARALSRRRPDITTQAQLGEGTPVAVLERAACRADLIVVGAPLLHPWRSIGIALARTAGCPVLVAACTPRATAPVTVVLRDPAGEAPLLDAAFGHAARRGTPLVVLRPWQPPATADLVPAETAEQKTLDEYLTGWQERFPHVGVSVELRVGSTVDVVGEHAARAEVLAIGQPRGRPDPLVASVLQQRRPTTLLVPLVVPRGTTIKIQPRQTTPHLPIRGVVAVLVGSLLGRVVPAG